MTIDILNIIKELDPILKVVITVVLAFATILGGFAAVHYFKNLSKQNKRQEEISSKIDHIIKQVETAPLPVMDFVDGLPQLDDAKKRDAFENGMKLRDEHKPLEAIDRFRFLLSINPSNEEKAALLISHL
jgi:hypothetical protein